MQDRFNELVQTDLPRFWDTEAKKMVYPRLTGINIICYDINNCNQPDDGTRSLCWMLLRSERFVRMKPIGHNDKSGKLIYEFDIVQGYANSTSCIGNKTNKQKLSNYLIRWSGIFYIGGWWQEEIDKNGLYPYLPRLDEIEIIGNKFEHPELLEVK